MNDVAIIGGGPAGAMAGLTLKSLHEDINVTLFESGRYPRSVCGGAVGSWWLKDMKLKPPDNVIISPVKKGYIHSPHRSLCLEKLPIKGEMGYLIDRKLFDRWLLGLADDAGVDIHMEETITSTKYNGFMWELASRKKEYNAYVLIRASGAVSKGNHAAYQEYIDLSNWDNPDSLDISKGTIHLFFAPSLVPDGYVWVFSLGDGIAKIGTASAKLNPKRVLHAFYKQKRMDTLSCIGRQGGLVGMGRPIYEGQEHEMIIGDAANFASPLHGGGIYTALKSGQIAAESINDIEAFEKKCRNNIGKLLDKHRYLQKIFLRLNDKEWDTVIASLNHFEVKSADPSTEIIRLALFLFKKHPKLISAGIINALLRA